MNPPQQAEEGCPRGKLARNCFFSLNSHPCYSVLNFLDRQVPTVSNVSEDKSFLLMTLGSPPCYWTEGLSNVLQYRCGDFFHFLSWTGSNFSSYSLLS